MLSKRRRRVVPSRRVVAADARCETRDEYDGPMTLFHVHDHDHDQELNAASGQGKPGRHGTFYV